ncbi:hypothetical protein SLEP1_g39733 [Rubroshorea leprosula]|uniref:Uncharacterized protein n=1 Tax=Rubroshorea leprosula TaxID=152421 RepID=A0AAV5L1I7_9ROSI|nr:hypothetical protein SLEP1_g39733 [Rubroshorea leprosula]
MSTTQSIETVSIPNGADQGINVLELEATDHRYINFSSRVLRRFFNRCYREVMHVQPQLRAGKNQKNTTFSLDDASWCMFPPDFELLET